MWQILSHHLPFPAGSHKRMVPKYDDILQKHYKPVESLILFFPVNGYVILGEADFHHRLSLMLSSILFVVLLDLQHVLYLVALVLVGQMMNYQILVFQHQHSSYKLQHLLNLQVEMLQDWYSSHDAPFSPKEILFFFFWKVAFALRTFHVFCFCLLLHQNYLMNYLEKKNLQNFQ